VAVQEPVWTEEPRMVRPSWLASSRTAVVRVTGKSLHPCPEEEKPPVGRFFLDQKRVKKKDERKNRAAPIELSKGPTALGQRPISYPTRQRCISVFSKCRLLIGALLLVAAAGWVALSLLRQGARRGTSVRASRNEGTDNRATFFLTSRHGRVLLLGS